MEYDLKLTPDGDLVLGQQQTNDQGEFLYYEDLFQNGGAPRLTTVPDGNVPVRDIEPVYGDESRLQLVHTRVKTDSPDFTLYPTLGANLSDLIGMRNNETNAQRGVQMIIDTLTADDAFDPNTIDVDVVPISEDEVLFDIKLMRQEVYARYAIIFNFELGIINEYEMR